VLYALAETAYEPKTLLIFLRNARTRTWTLGELDPRSGLICSRAFGVSYELDDEAEKI
jgi:hypothetical protein